jgi:hypothetical protein
MPGIPMPENFKIAGNVDVLCVKLNESFWEPFPKTKLFATSKLFAT